MEEKSEKEEGFGRIIRIAKKEPEKYAFAILKSLQPINYEEHGEVKIQVTEANLTKAEYVLSFFRNLWIEEINRERKKIEQVNPEGGVSYPLEVIEITLKKHPKLRR